MTGEIGSIYTLHFNAPIGGSGRNSASHYTGWAKGDATARIAHHRRGNSGAKIVEHVVASGIGFVVGDIRPGTREDERRIKNNGNHARRCAVCQGREAVAV